MHAIWKMIYTIRILKLLSPFGILELLTVNTFSAFVYAVSCMPAARVNHVIPCFSIRWKSKGSLFINCLTLNLSWSLIMTPLGKSILLPLKVKGATFHSICSVSHR